jgi:hypothetical protein
MRVTTIPVREPLLAQPANGSNPRVDSAGLEESIAVRSRRE